MKFCVFLMSLAISLGSQANDKVRCDSLTHSPYDFYDKVPSIYQGDIQTISPYVKVDDTRKDFLKINDRAIDVCEYVNEDKDEVISYLIYSGDDVIFLNNNALGDLDLEQGVVFRYIQYDEKELKIYFESSGGASEDYSSFEFYFLPYQNDFLLNKVINSYNIEVSDGFDLAKKEIILPDTYLSKFNFESFLDSL
ncbi:hypothetical protein PL85_11165 [Vibrio anguillarum]|uniref:Uncharacterized protein n=14 Tax=Vibrio TaxID=662 RepID=A0ABD4KVK8_VIBAN|nr:hypothetical protein [Vibrio anguillarum]OEE73605.1 hypothetical protein A1QQ_04855 [Vibrio ordalii FF-167]MBF4232162.1 hypothetical protein [Vibrio anguillarum]MBF4274626.1 hypothetical protein [Vibrio anguillarum]MBF4283690.1 hypothetical protein [Vibrio anguillarum]MBF4288335.1 hypothetical protein [Vibrio anguillarum]